MPSAEQLLVDPELLRQTEGSQVNQSLLSFASTLRKLAQGNQAHTIDHNGSILTKLLAGMLLGFLPCLTGGVHNLQERDTEGTMQLLCHGSTGF